MANKLTDIVAISTISLLDLLYIVDVDDTTDDAAGSSKSMTVGQLVTVVRDSVSSATIVDNTVSPTTIFTYPAANRYAKIDFSLEKDGERQLATWNIINDGSVITDSIVDIQTGPTGVTLSAVIAGANVLIQYTSTSTGGDGTMKYQIKKWG